MGDIKLLDCTLRDGGYVNDWNFGHNNLVSIFERLVDANVDIIEIGFLDERREFDINRSIMPDTDSVSKIYGDLDKKNALIVGMIDFGTCGLEHIRPCSETYLDGIRVIFKKHLMIPAMEFCNELKKKGYMVFAQLVSVTSYSDREMLQLIDLANKVEPYAVSMVDTYGLMHQNNMLHYFELLNHNLNKTIGIGYHAHNNFQMGYANCIALLSQKIDRMVVVDGTIYGMGKSAGNAPIELIAMYMNHALNKQYHISQILEAMDSNITQFYQPATWGYNMFYYLAASNDCHPNYVTYYMNKRTLSVKSINEILGKLQGEKKLLYDKDYAESLYKEYQLHEVNDAVDIESLSKIFVGKEILLIGPGNSITEECKKIEKFVKEKTPLTISINYIPEQINSDYLFISNSKRYVQLSTRLCKYDKKIIATSNVTGTSKDAFDYVLNYSTLIDNNAEIIDNSLVMLLKALKIMGVKSVSLAGFDGYSSRNTNYFNKSMEYEFVRRMADYLNNYTVNFIREISNCMKIKFVTDSKYMDGLRNE